MSASSEAPTANATATVVLPANLHARPAGKLARVAAEFASTITIEHAGKTINPTGVLSVMGLGAIAGTAITITAEGPDAEPAVRALVEVLSNAT